MCVKASIDRHVKRAFPDELPVPFDMLLIKMFSQSQPHQPLPATSATIAECLCGGMFAKLKKAQRKTNMFGSKLALCLTILSSCKQDKALKITQSEEK